MKRKRIQYNELNEEIYSPIYWTKIRLVITGVTLLFFGFLFNFSLEDKMNRWLQTSLSSNEACPIVFDKAELSYFLPKIIIKKPIIQGSCFGQVNNKLPLQSIKIAFSRPSFYPPGIKLHVTILEGKTLLNIYPSISPLFHYIQIEDSKIDSQVFASMTSDNKSPVAGTLEINASLKIVNNSIEDGLMAINSTNFRLPTQNFKGFEMSQVLLNRLIFEAHFSNKNTLQIDKIQIGKSAMPIDLNLKGQLAISPVSFSHSQLQLNGTLRLSPAILSNFSFVKLFLPQDNTSGTYQMKLMGPIGNLGAPQFK